MATAVGDLVIRYGAQTRPATTKLTGLRKTVAGVSSAALGMMRTLAPLGGAAIFAGVVRSGEMFNRKMRSSLAIMGEVSEAMRKDMRAAAFAVARYTRFAAAAAAGAFFFLASAGLDARQSIAALPQVARFAQAGNFDLARATDLATDAQSALGMTVKDSAQNLKNLTRVTDVLIKANTLANASAEQFSESLTTKAGAAMRIVGKDIEEGVAVLAAWADQGVKGADSGTALNIVFRDLQSKALLNKKAFKQAGVAVFDAAGEMRNMADIVLDLERKLGGMSDAQKKATLMQLGFSDKSVIFIQSLIGMSEKIREYEKQLRLAGGTTKEVADKQLTPLQRGVAKLGAVWTSVGASLMKTMGPALERGLKGTATGIEFVWLTTVSLFNAIRQSPVGAFLRQFAKIAVIGAAMMALVPIVSVVGAAIGTAFTVAMGPIGVAIALAVILGAFFVELTGKGETFGEKLNDVLSKIPDLIDGLGFAFRNFSAIAQLALIDIVLKAVELFPQMEKPLGHVAAFFMGTFAGMKAFFSSIIQSIIGGLKEVGNFAKAIGAGIMAAYEAIKNMDFKGAGTAFMDAFTEELASQADVKAPNAFKEFHKAFNNAAEATRGKMQKAGGLSKLMEQQKRDLLKGIAQHELDLIDAAERAKKATEAAGADAQQAPEKQIDVLTKGQSKWAAAMEKGSAAAYSQTLRAGREGQKPLDDIKKNTGDTAKAGAETNQKLGELIDKEGNFTDIPF